MHALLAAALRRIAPQVIKRYLIPLIETRLSRRGADVDLDRVFDLVADLEETNLSGEQRRRKVLSLVGDLVHEKGEAYARLLIELALARARGEGKKAA